MRESEDWACRKSVLTGRKQENRAKIHILWTLLCSRNVRIGPLTQQPKSRRAVRSPCEAFEVSEQAETKHESFSSLTFSNSVPLSDSISSQGCNCFVVTCSRKDDAEGGDRHNRAGSLVFASFPAYLWPAMPVTWEVCFCWSVATPSLWSSDVCDLYDEGFSYYITLIDGLLYGS